MKFNKIKDIQSDNFILFASLPDIGKVGGIASAYLAENLKDGIRSRIGGSHIGVPLHGRIGGFCRIERLAKKRAMAFLRRSAKA